MINFLVNNCMRPSLKYILAFALLTISTKASDYFDDISFPPSVQPPPIDPKPFGNNMRGTMTNSFNSGMNGFGNSMNGFGNSMSNDFNSGMNGLGNSMNNGFNSFGNSLNGFENSMSNGMNDFGNSMNSGMNSFGNTMNGLGNSMSNGFNNMGNSMNTGMNSFGNSMNGFGNSMTNGFNNMGNSMSNGFNNMGNSMGMSNGGSHHHRRRRKFRGIKSPFYNLTLRTVNKIRTRTNPCAHRSMLKYQGLIKNSKIRLMFMRDLAQLMHNPKVGSPCGHSRLTLKHRLILLKDPYFRRTLLKYVKKHPFRPGIFYGQRRDRPSGSQAL